MSEKKTLICSAFNTNLNGPIPSEVLEPFLESQRDEESFDEILLQRVMIFYNPVAGGGSSKHIVANIVIPIFHKHNISTIVYPTKCANDLARYLEKEHSKIEKYGIDVFVVIGGDGTMNEFVNGYVRGHWSTNRKKKIPCILLPGGSGNSLCLTMNGFNDDEEKLKKYLHQILQQKCVSKMIRWLDVIELSDEDGKVLKYCGSQSYFGIPSASVHWANCDLFKSIFGTLSLRYDIAAIIEMCKHGEYRLKFTFYGLQRPKNSNKDIVDKNVVELIESVEMFAAMKGKYFGKGICITPFAKLDNGYLDVMILKRTENIMRLISLFLRLQNVKGNMDVLSEQEVLYYRCKELQVDVVDENDKIIREKSILEKLDLPDVGGDGEIGPNLPLKIKAVHQALPLLFPSIWFVHTF